MLIWGYSYKEPTVAYASEVEIGVAIDEALTAAMKALGIGVAASVTAPMYQVILEHLKTSAVMTAFAGCTGAVVGGKTIYNLTTNFLTEVGNQIKATYDTALSNYESNTLLNNIPTALQSNMSYNKYADELFASLGFAAPYFIYYNGSASDPRISAYKILGVIPYPAVVDQSYTYSCGNVICYYKKSSDGIDVRYNTSQSWSPTKIVPLITGTSIGYVIAYSVVGYSGWNYVCTSGQLTYGSLSNTFGIGNDTAVPVAPGYDVYGTDTDKWFADGYSALNNSVSDVVGRVGDAVGVTGQDGTKSIPVSIPVGSDTDVSKGREADQDSTLGKDVATDADKEKDATTNTGKDTTLPKPAALPDLSLPEVVFKDKFPFCLPWDLYTAFSNLVAAPTPPEWNVPFTVKSMNFTQNMTIDFSQFSTLAAILRWGLSLIFIIGLILVTRKLIGAGG